MEKYCTILLALFLIISCNQKEEDKVIIVKSTHTIDTTKQKAAKKAVNEQLADTIRMVVKNKKGSYTAIGTIDSIHPRIYIKFTSETHGYLHAMVKPIPPSEGNIRFSQILFPNSMADGPCGHDVFMKQKQTGEHTLSIGHSIMAEKPYSGRFRRGPVPSILWQN